MDDATDFFMLFDMQHFAYGGFKVNGKAPEKAFHLSASPQIIRKSSGVTEMSHKKQMEYFPCGYLIKIPINSHLTQCLSE